MNLEDYIQSAFYRKGGWESGWGLNREVTRSVFSDFVKRIFWLQSQESREEAIIIIIITINDGNN